MDKRKDSVSVTIEQTVTTKTVVKLEGATETKNTMTPQIIVLVVDRAE